MGSKLPVPAFLCFLTLCFLPAAEMNSSDNDFVNVLRWTETLIGSQNRGDKPLKIRNILTISKQMVTGNFYDMKLEFSRASCPKDHANDCAFDASATPLICEVKVYDEPISGTRTSPKFSCSSMQREGNNSTLELKAGDPEPSSVEVTTTTTTESSAKFCESIPKGQLNAISKEGITKLYAAAQSGDVPLTEKLLNCGANPLRSSNLQEGNLPIHIAALNGHERIVEALLNHGVNPDVRRKDGLAALHIALKGDGTNLLPVLEMLALKGANLNVVTGDEQHKRPLDIALDVGLPNDVIRFLIEHGAKRGDETL